MDILLTNDFDTLTNEQKNQSQFYRLTPNLIQHVKSVNFLNKFNIVGTINFHL